MTNYDKLKIHLINKKYTWLITGVAGFIGCNLLRELLLLNQYVVGIDNFSTGHQHNLDQILSHVGPNLQKNFKFTTGDICNLSDCKLVIKDVDFVLHHAALGSVPRSLVDPISSNFTNVNGFLNMLVVSKDFNIKRFVYAASSSTYGDHTTLPKIEDAIGRQLSPYAVTKYVNELYAEVFSRCFNLSTLGLRYFNVFGPHQDPNGAYAAVIPKWIFGIINNENIYINGDGSTSRDFCYIDNVIQANLLAATAQLNINNNIFNISYGEKTTLNDLYNLIINELMKHEPNLKVNLPKHLDFRSGDIRHSLANIEKASKFLGYKPTHSLTSGIINTVEWYFNNLK